MAKVSIIIPVRGEKEENLKRTLDSIYKNATGDFEVILGFNGEPFYEFNHIYSKETLAGAITEESTEDFPYYPNLKIIKFPKNIGIKGNINTLALLATGEYLLKLDAHCSIGKGFDEILKADMQEDWIVTPRFYVLNGETWNVQDDRFYDYFYLCCPFTDPKGLRFKAGGHWPERTEERDTYGKLDYIIDETPQMHGSAWFMTKKRFFDLGGFPLTDPYGHGQEPLWLGLRNQLRGGKLMVNKKTWYAHLHQNSKDRGYPEDKQETERTYKLTAEYFLGNKDPEIIHDFEWFVDKFSPMPTWPDNWRELYGEWLINSKV